jgi:hypothetical protein
MIAAPFMRFPRGSNQRRPLGLVDRNQRRIQPQNRKRTLAPSVMRRRRLARPIERPRQQRQIAGRRLKQEPLVNVVNTSYIRPIHASGIELMCKIPLQFCVCPWPCPILR